MRTINLGQTGFQVPVIAVGCWRADKAGKSETETFVKSALDHSANFFDHADVYGRGLAEEFFAEAAGINARLRLIEKEINIC
jgi:predicted oxidoreductase